MALARQGAPLHLFPSPIDGDVQAFTILEFPLSGIFWCPNTAEQEALGIVVSLRRPLLEDRGLSNFGLQEGRRKVEQIRQAGLLLFGAGRCREASYERKRLVKPAA